MGKSGHGLVAVGSLKDVQVWSCLVKTFLLKHEALSHAIRYSNGLNYHFLDKNGPIRRWCR